MIDHQKCLAWIVAVTSSSGLHVRQTFTVVSISLELVCLLIAMTEFRCLRRPRKSVMAIERLTSSREILTTVKVPICLKLA